MLSYSKACFGVPKHGTQQAGVLPPPLTIRPHSAPGPAPVSVAHVSTFFQPRRCRQQSRRKKLQLAEHNWSKATEIDGVNDRAVCHQPDG